jgi:hypothetical protein
MFEKGFEEWQNNSEEPPDEFASENSQKIEKGDNSA